jgi:hypothetical protein
MRNVTLQTTIGPDGVIDLHIPSDLPPGPAEVEVTALFWREFAPRRLPPEVLQVFEDIEAGRAEAIPVPIVMAEFYYVLHKEGLEQDASLYLQYVKRLIR